MEPIDTLEGTTTEGTAPPAATRPRLPFARQASALVRLLRRVGSALLRRLRQVLSYRTVRVACLIVGCLMLLPPVALIHHVYFDRTDLPDLAPFLRFQPPTTG